MRERKNNGSTWERKKVSSVEMKRVKTGGRKRGCENDG